MSGLRERLQRRESLVGTFCSVPHAAIIELTATAGFDFLVVECEHSTINRGDIEHLVRAAEVAGAALLFRVPAAYSHWISSVLDAGGHGVIVPSVASAEEARSVVAAARHPPAGRRGVPMSRANGFGARFSTYFEEAGKTVVAVMIETAEGLSNADAIAAVEGIDAILIGPGDLSASLGLSGAQAGRQLEAATDQILAACRRSNRPAGSFHYGASSVGPAIARGDLFHIVGGDVLFLQEGASRVVKAIRELSKKESA